MSIFDTIANGVTSLFDDPISTLTDIGGDIFTSGSTANKIIGTAVKGYEAVQKQGREQQSENSQLMALIERNSRTQDTDQKDFKSTPNQKYGAPDYSVSAGNVEAAWRQYLGGVASSKVVPGKRYSEMN